MELGPAVVEAAYSRVPLDRAHGRPAGRAARPGRAPDDRPGPPLRAAGEVVRGAAAVRRRSGDRGARAIAGGSRRRDGARRTRGTRAPQRAVPRAAAARRSAWGRRTDGVDVGAVRDRRSTGRRTPRRRRARRARRPPRGRRSAASSSPGPDDDPALPEALAALAARDRLPDPRRPAVRPPDRRPRPEPGDRAGGPARAARAPGSTPIARSSSSGPARCPPPSRSRSCSRGRRPELIVLDGDGGWRESALVPATFVHADAGRDRAARSPRAPRGRRRRRGRGPADWLARRPGGGRGDGRAGWPRSTSRSRARRSRRSRPPCPTASTLWAGNSMPVRDMDGWLPSTERAITVRSNRGANGIDGVVSTALGSAAVAAGPVALVVGDVSFLHDLNALVAAKLHGLSATIVLVNNDGGGIFSFLPQARPRIPGRRPAGPLRGAVRDAARDRRRADRDGAGRRARRWSGRATCRAQVERSIGCAGRPGARAAHRSRAERRAPPRGRRGRRARRSGREPAWTSTALRWEVRARGTGTAAAADPRLHGPRARRGRVMPTAFARAFRLDRRGPAGPRRHAPTGDPRRMTVERTADDLAAILRRLGAAPADVVGYSLGARIALRLAVAHPTSSRRLVLESPSAGIADRRSRGPSGAPPTRPSPTGSSATGSPAFVAEWEAPADLRAPRPPCPRPAPRGSGAIRLANRPDGLAGEPARRRPGRDGAARRSPRARSAPRRSSSPARSTTVGRPRADRSPPGSRAPGSPSSTAPATPRTTSGPTAFRRLALDFLQEDAA